MHIIIPARQMHTAVDVIIMHHRFRDTALQMPDQNWMKNEVYLTVTLLFILRREISKLKTIIN